MSDIAAIFTAVVALIELVSACSQFVLPRCLLPCMTSSLKLEDFRNLMAGQSLVR
jgi:hypothetical protein